MDTTVAPAPGGVPQHIAIIMDGNGRWAKARGLPRSEGHKAGAEPVREILKAAHALGVKYLTLYTFSSENWQRSQSEVESLFSLLLRYLDSETQELLISGVKLNAVGDLDKLPKATLDALFDAMEATSANTDITLTLALSYGARAEITQAARRLCEKCAGGILKPEDLTEELFRSELWSEMLPDIDLLIRTGGEQRISNFLLWHLAYAELYITDTLWPDFAKEDLVKAIEDFKVRVRRFGR
ncbi:MAG: di-trans,poly-cis-decaprenylcistransferase [Deltaproteobacteria bacterium]|jgi:undecaprenyl diphosphate synthase|nr:di-trans,poly-cis-decaprenylcistransferase [Deltaproteobacteria bacterium]